MEATTNSTARRIRSIEAQIELELFAAAAYIADGTPLLAIEHEQYAHQLDVQLHILRAQLVAEVRTLVAA